MPTYDEDGNLLTDGSYAYTWDGENRLAMVEPIDPVDGDLREKFTYDYMGRRVRTLVEKYGASASIWTSAEDTRYVYDGWNVVLELDGEDSNAVAKKYTWGLDVSGSMQGAGGVGGLLACEDLKTSATSTDDVQYVFNYDGNGNVMALTDSSYM